MHKISNSSVQLAKIHAKKAHEHGKLLEIWGKRLQQRNFSAQEYGEFIEHYGKTVQGYAQQSLLNAEQLEGSVSRETELYGEAVQAHVNATQAHIQAIKIYIQLIGEKLKEGTKRVTEETNLNKP